MLGSKRPAYTATKGSTASSQRASAMALAAAPAGAVHAHVKEVLFAQHAIEERVRALGGELTLSYADRKPVVLQVMCGAFMFAADLCRHFDVPGMQVDAVRASSYGEHTESSGQVAISGLTTEVSGRHVLLVEDIVDTGLTLEKVRAYILEKGASSCAIVTLLDKKSRRKNGLVPEFIGFDCPDEFVIGYGLDYGGLYRQLPYIGVLDPKHI